MFEGFVCEIEVDSPEMRLKRLSLEDTESIFNLVQQNTDHLTKYGDYADLVARSLDDWNEIFEPPSDSELTMGMFRGHELFGAVSLIYYKPKVFGLGYWVDAHDLGRGYVTDACQALVRFARTEYAAAEIWAGIKSQNQPSIAVAERLGFQLVRTQESHLSYLLDFSGSD